MEKSWAAPAPSHPGTPVRSLFNKEKSCFAMANKKIELNDNDVDKVVGGVGCRPNQGAGKSGVKTGIGDVSGGIQNGADNASNSVKNAADQANSLQRPNP